MPHLNIALTELYDREGFSHRPPITFIVDRANFGTVPLKKTKIKIKESRV